MPSEGLLPFLAGADDVRALIHMGAIPDTTESDADLTADTNLTLSLRLWEWCSTRRAPLIYPSSAATYGDGSAGFCDDNDSLALTRLRPLNAYGWSKHAFDRRVIDFVARGHRNGPVSNSLMSNDQSVRRLKGPGRPVQTESVRAAVLACLDLVDLVVIFSEPTPISLIAAVRPDLLVKGADYVLGEVVGADLVQSYGGTVLLAELKQGFSTTRMIARIDGEDPPADTVVLA